MDRIFKIRCSEIGTIMGASRPAGFLSAACQSYLRKWYANDNEPVHSKYMDKGIMMEGDAIELMVDVLGLGYAEKNLQHFENDFITGTPDVITSDTIYDVKCAWNRETLNNHAIELIDSDYEWQLRGYMAITGRSKAVLFHALVDTPEEVNFGNEVTYTHLPLNERWVGFEIKHDPEIIKNIEQQVIKCREWLENYDKSIKNKLGKIN